MAAGVSHTLQPLVLTNTPFLIKDAATLHAQVPPLRTATGRPASPLVRWRLLEALYAYALVGQVIPKT
jgi:hypothetical protein